MTGGLKLDGRMLSNHRQSRRSVGSFSGDGGASIVSGDTWGDDDDDGESSSHVGHSTVTSSSSRIDELSFALDQVMEKRKGQPRTNAGGRIPPSSFDRRHQLPTIASNKALHEGFGSSDETPSTTSLTQPLTLRSSFVGDDEEEEEDSVQPDDLEAAQYEYGALNDSGGGMDGLKIPANWGIDGEGSCSTLDEDTALHSASSGGKGHRSVGSRDKIEVDIDGRQKQATPRKGGGGLLRGLSQKLLKSVSSKRLQQPPQEANPMTRDSVLDQTAPTAATSIDFPPTVIDPHRASDVVSELGTTIAPFSTSSGSSAGGSSTKRRNLLQRAGSLRRLGGGGGSGGGGMGGSGSSHSNTKLEKKKTAIEESLMNQLAQMQANQAQQLQEMALKLQQREAAIKTLEKALTLQTGTVDDLRSELSNVRTKLKKTETKLDTKISSNRSADGGGTAKREGGRGRRQRSMSLTDNHSSRSPSPTTALRQHVSSSNLSPWLSPGGLSVSGMGQQNAAWEDSPPEIPFPSLQLPACTKTEFPLPLARQGNTPTATTTNSAFNNQKRSTSDEDDGADRKAHHDAKSVNLFDTNSGFFPSFGSSHSTSRFKFDLGGSPEEGSDEDKGDSDSEDDNNKDSSNLGFRFNAGRKPPMQSLNRNSSTRSMSRLLDNHLSSPSRKPHGVRKASSTNSLSGLLDKHIETDRHSARQATTTRSQSTGRSRGGGLSPRRASPMSADLTIASATTTASSRHPSPAATPTSEVSSLLLGEKLVDTTDSSSAMKVSKHSLFSSVSQTTVETNNHKKEEVVVDDDDDGPAQRARSTPRTRPKSTGRPSSSSKRGDGGQRRSGSRVRGESDRHRSRYSSSGRSASRRDLARSYSTSRLRDDDYDARRRRDDSKRRAASSSRRQTHEEEASSSSSKRRDRDRERDSDRDRDRDRNRDRDLDRQHRSRRETSYKSKSRPLRTDNERDDRHRRVDSRHRRHGEEGHQSRSGHSTSTGSSRPRRPGTTSRSKDGRPHGGGGGGGGSIASGGSRRRKEEDSRTRDGEERRTSSSSSRRRRREGDGASPTNNHRDDAERRRRREEQRREEQRREGPRRREGESRAHPRSTRQRPAETTTTTKTGERRSSSGSPVSGRSNSAPVRQLPPRSKSLKFDAASRTDEDL